jgi:hypothetical protein
MPSLRLGPARAARWLWVLVEPLVEAPGGSTPWLSSRTFDGRCYAALHIANGLQWLLCGSPRVGIPLFNECEQAAANLRYRHTELCADGAAALLPVVGWSGGDYPGCFEHSISGWQVGHPLSQ